MPASLDNILDNLSPAELVAFEHDLDQKHSAELEGNCIKAGSDMAKAALARLHDTGEVDDALYLAKEAGSFKGLSPEVKEKFEANKKNPPGKAGGPGYGSKKKGPLKEAGLEHSIRMAQLHIESGRHLAKHAKINFLAKGIRSVGRFFGGKASPAGKGILGAAGWAQKNPMKASAIAGGGGLLAFNKIRNRNN